MPIRNPWWLGVFICWITEGRNAVKVATSARRARNVVEQICFHLINNDVAHQKFAT
jgi:hypothetical protein